MKKITIILLLIVVFGISVFAQTKLNNNKLVGFDFSNTFMLDKNYSQNHFLRGWNWGFGDKGLQLDRSYDINTYHHYIYYSSLLASDFNTNFRSYTPISVRLHTSRKKFSRLGGLGLYLEPSLNVNTSGTFAPNIEADNGSAFGFQSKTGGSNTIIF